MGKDEHMFQNKPIEDIKKIEQQGDNNNLPS